jgi:dienelactone hydrolase
VSGRKTVLRRMGAAGVRFEPTDAGDLPGMLILPGGEAPASGWPGVACFGGSEGGFESQLSNAAVLAARGFAAYAAPWISEADAAVNISEVPLERFAAALSVLADHPAVDGSALSAMAISRGAEGLLAAISRRLGPPLRALVLISPSAVAWQALGSSGEVPDTASWTVEGRPVPWVPLASGVLMRQIVRNAWTVGRDIAHQRPTLLRLRPAYENSLVAAGLLARRGDAGLPGLPAAGARVVDSVAMVSGAAGGAVSNGAVLDATKVTCPLLMLAGRADELWPAESMARLLAAQRAAAGMDRVDQLQAYDAAGHLIRLGLLPTDAPWTNGIAFGGSREGLAAAQADATTRVVEFLKSWVGTAAARR